MLIIEESNPVEKKTICNLIIIDASGSMSSKIAEVKSGLLELFGDIKNDDKVNQHTIVCDFSNDFRVLVNSRNIEDLKSDIANNYTTRGSTALRDAIGQGFSLVPEDVHGVFVSIITDGEENASKEHSVDSIKALIAAKKEQKWGITFMGTTEEAMLAANDWGINLANTISYDNSSAGTIHASMSRGLARKSYSTSVCYASNTSDIQADNLMGQSTFTSGESLVTTTGIDLSVEQVVDRNKKKKDKTPTK